MNECVYCQFHDKGAHCRECGRYVKPYLIPGAIMVILGGTAIPLALALFAITKVL